MSTGGCFSTERPIIQQFSESEAKAATNPGDRRYSEKEKGTQSTLSWTSGEKSRRRMNFCRPEDTALVELATNTENVALGAKKRPVAGFSLQSQ